jgi:hypothetical protein
MGIFQLNKKLSLESLNYDPASTSSDGQVSPVQNLMKDLKQEIEAKDLLLKDKVDTISELEDKISVRDREIKELSQKNGACDQALRTSQSMVSKHGKMMIIIDTLKCPNACLFSDI